MSNQTTCLSVSPSIWHYAPQLKNHKPVTAPPKLFSLDPEVKERMKTGTTTSQCSSSPSSSKAAKYMHAIEEISRKSTEEGKQVREEQSLVRQVILVSGLGEPPCPRGTRLGTDKTQGKGTCQWRRKGLRRLETPSG